MDIGVVAVPDEFGEMVPGEPTDSAEEITVSEG